MPSVSVEEAKEHGYWSRVYKIPHDIGRKISGVNLNTILTNTGLLKIGVPYDITCKSMDLAHLGAGIPLYFKFLKFLILALLCYGIAAIVMMIEYNKFNHFGNWENASTSFIKSIYSLGNVGPFDTSVSDRSVIDSSIKLISVVVFISFLLISILLTIQSRLNLINTKEIDRLNTLPNDYAIIVNNVPTDCINEDEIISFFEQNGLLNNTSCKVVKVIMGFNISLYMTTLCRLNKVNLTLEKINKGYQNIHNTWIENILSYFTDFWDPNDDIVTMKKSELLKEEERLAQIMRDIQSRNKKLENSGCAIVLFKHQHDQRKVLSLWEKSIFLHFLDVLFNNSLINTKMFRGKHRLRVARAPNPDDIIWSNMGVTVKERVIACTRTIGLIFVMIVISFGIVYGLSYLNKRIGNRDDISSVYTMILSCLISIPIMGTNLVLHKLINMSVRKQRLLTRSAEDTMEMFCLVLSTCLNTAAVQFLVSINPEKWFIGGGLLQNMIIQFIMAIFMPLITIVNVDRILKKWKLSNINITDDKTLQNNARGRKSGHNNPSVVRPADGITLENTIALTNQVSNDNSKTISGNSNPVIENSEESSKNPVACDNQKANNGITLNHARRNDADLNAITQGELNKLYEGAPFILPMKYANVLRIFIVCAIYVPILPVSIIIGIIGICVQWITDRYALLRQCTRPYMQSEIIANYALVVMQVALIVVFGFFLTFMKGTQCDITYFFDASINTITARDNESDDSLICSRSYNLIYYLFLFGLIGAAINFVIPDKWMTYICCTFLCAKDNNTTDNFIDAPNYYQAQLSFSKLDKYHLSNPIYASLPKEQNPENLIDPDQFATSENTMDLNRGSMNNVNSIINIDNEKRAQANFGVGAINGGSNNAIITENNDGYGGTSSLNVGMYRNNVASTNGLSDGLRLRNRAGIDFNQMQQNYSSLNNMFYANGGSNTLISNNDYYNNRYDASFVASHTYERMGLHVLNNRLQQPPYISSQQPQLTSLPPLQYNIINNAYTGSNVLHQNSFVYSPHAPTQGGRIFSPLATTQHFANGPQFPAPMHQGNTQSVSSFPSHNIIQTGISMQESRIVPTYAPTSPNVQHGEYRASLYNSVQPELTQYGNSENIVGGFVQSQQNNNDGEGNKGYNDIQSRITHNTNIQEKNELTLNNYATQGNELSLHSNTRKKNNSITPSSLLKDHSNNT